MSARPAPLNPLPVLRPGPPELVAEAGYAATARAVGLVPPRGMVLDESGRADPPPAMSGLDALMPGGEAGLVLPLALAALRPDLKQWLGEDRLADIAKGLGLSEKKLLALLGAAPLPPASLGEASLWAGQRLPLQAGGTPGWVELFWRPDRRPRAGQHDRGAFAIRLFLPGTGAIELRGRLEGRRLDAVMETARALPRLAAAELAETFDHVLHRLKLAGNLTVRHTKQDRRT
jgi:hypothetical protein